MKSLTKQGEEARFYSKCNEDLLESFKPGNDVTFLCFKKAKDHHHIIYSLQGSVCVCGCVYVYWILMVADT